MAISVMLRSNTFNFDLRCKALKKTDGPVKQKKNQINKYNRTLRGPGKI